MNTKVNKDVFIQSLHTLQRAEIAIKLTNNGISVKDVENALNGRLCDLIDVIDIYKLSSITINE